jgi:hypothetical protein
MDEGLNIDAQSTEKPTTSQPINIKARQRPPSQQSLR